jgi:APA family basic amino acid/polyamine antiporter
MVLLVLEYGLAASTVAVGWSGYVASFLHDFGLDIPPALRGAWGTPVTDFLTGDVVGTGVVNLPAVIATAAVIGLLILGVSESAFVNNVVVAIKVTVVVAFIAIGAFYVNPDLWSPLVPAQTPAPRTWGSGESAGALGGRDGAEHGPVRRPGSSRRPRRSSSLTSVSKRCRRPARNRRIRGATCRSAFWDR